MNWSFTVGSNPDGAGGYRPSMYVRRFFDIKGYCLDLHKMVRADAPECFHSHPAKAIRIVLWGGYEEEVYEEWKTSQYVHVFRDFVKCAVGHIGIVQPEFVHRVSKLNKSASYSLWLRAPISSEIKLVGEGWQKGAP